MPTKVINKAVAIGTHTFLIPIFAALAVVRTGAIINATTAGRIPLNILSTVGLSYMVTKNIAIANIIINDGNMVPSAANVAPVFLAILLQTKTDIFTASIPGID